MKEIPVLLNTIFIEERAIAHELKKEDPENAKDIIDEYANKLHDQAVIPESERTEPTGTTDRDN